MAAIIDGRLSYPLFKERFVNQKDMNALHSVCIKQTWIIGNVTEMIDIQLIMCTPSNLEKLTSAIRRSLAIE